MNYSTTRLVTHIIPEDLSELPVNQNRQGEGGLRLHGKYKKSLPGKPLISVITVVFNGEQFIEETILSVLNQTYDNVEYIIIDGGSTDGTVDIIEKYEGAIDYWRSEPDGGIYDAMNKGVSISLGDWCNFMNAGDTFADLDTIEIIVPFLNNSLSLLYGSCRFISSNYSYRFSPKRLTRLSFLKHVIFNHQASFIKRDRFLPFNTDKTVSADFEQVFKLYKNNKDALQCLENEVLAICRLEGVSYSQMYRSFLDRLQCFRDNDFILYMLLFVYKPFFYVKTYLIRLLNDSLFLKCYRKLKYNA